MLPSVANTNSVSVAGRNPEATKGKPAGAPGASEPAANPTQADPMAELLLAQGAAAAADYRPHKQTPASISPQQSMASKQTAHEPSLKPTIIQGHFAVDRVSIKAGKSIGHIRVEAEETLGHYAEWLNVPVGDIRRLNGFQYGRLLQLSQKIKIPLDRVTKNDFEVKRFEYHQELSEDFFASYRVEKVWAYSIKRGDNIWTLSRQEFDVPMWLIKHYNGDVDFSALIPSQKLLIPVVEKNV
jgi:membrane-bound lytic murein transglycosylase D